MERTWHYADGGQPQGPVTEAALRTMIAEGNLPPQVLVCNQALGHTAWRPASDFEMFRPRAHEPSLPSLPALPTFPSQPMPSYSQNPPQSSLLQNASISPFPSNALPSPTSAAPYKPESARTLPGGDATQYDPKAVRNLPMGGMAPAPVTNSEATIWGLLYLCLYLPFQWIGWILWLVIEFLSAFSE